MSITKTSRRAERIAEAIPVRYAVAMYQDGHLCSYQPDPEFPIGWEFAATSLEPELSGGTAIRMERSEFERPF